MKYFLFVAFLCIYYISEYIIYRVYIYIGEEKEEV